MQKSDQNINPNSAAEKQAECLKLSYPKAPLRNLQLRRSNQQVQLISNLMELSFPNELKKIIIYSIEIKPIVENDFPLFNKIMKTIDEDLSHCFQKKMIAGFNLFAIPIDNRTQIYKIPKEVENVNYEIIITKVSIFDFREIVDYEGTNLKKKQFIEKLVKNILLSCKDVIRFGDDRTVVKMSAENTSQIGKNNESIYKGFYTSAQITESGLYLLVLNINKYISGKTVYDKITEIRKSYPRYSEQEIREKIEEYISTHRTVLTIYGSFRAYRIDSISFERTPSNTTFNLRINGGFQTLTVANYFEKQYNQKIKDKNQPLLIAERDKKTRKLLLLGDGNNNNINNNKNEENCIYLVPELLFTTGMDTDNANTLHSRRDIITKTKTNPNQRMAEINKIHDLYNSNEPKEFRKKDGTLVKNKSSREIADEWGINIGDNLKLDGRAIPQPTLNFNGQNKVTTRNGIFRSEKIFEPVSLSKDSFIYIYDRNDRNDLKHILKGLIDKARMKLMQIHGSVNDIRGFSINDTHSWRNIKNCLDSFHLNNRGILMALIFASPTLEKYYNELKDYFTNVLNIDSQVCVTKKLSDPRRAGSIMFNIVEQMNVKLGGTNFYIDFYDEGILDRSKIYLIMGLEVKTVSGGNIDYVLTCAMNNKLNKTITIPRTCKNNKEEKQKIIIELMDEAIKGFANIGKAPHPPDYIIIFRQGGNQVQNQKLLEDEVPFFVKYINEQKKNRESFRRHDTKLMFVCCNLKSDLKFFEVNKFDNHNNYDKKLSYGNPGSGLCVDAKVIRKDKFEFYLQPQFVNQGTATPCHYEVIYQDVDENNPDNNIKLENFQKLCFYLSFYYPTWSGAVRVPGVLKLSTTAIDFYDRCLKNKLELPGQLFKRPSYI